MPRSVAPRALHRNGESGAAEPPALRAVLDRRDQIVGREIMGKGILLWLLGIPIPIIILLLLFWR